jgi:hypothetical protein
LIDHTVDRTLSLRHIPPEAPDEPQVGVGIDKDLDVEQLPKGWDCEDENSFDENYRLRLDPLGGGDADVASEIVNWQGSSLTHFQQAEVPFQELLFDRIGVVEVVMRTLMIGKMGQVVVIPILTDDDNPFLSDATHDFVGYRRLARPGAACHADAESLHWFALSVR